MARSLKAVLAALTIALGWPSHAPAQDCSVDMSANPSTIYVGQQSTLGVSLAPPTYTPLGCLVSPTANPCGTLKWCVKPTVTTTYSAWCSFRRPTGTTCYASDSTTVTVTATPKPTVSLSVDKPMVAEGDPAPVTLSWKVTGASSCNATGGTWSGSKSPTGGPESVPPPGKTSSYKLSCTGSGGSASSSATVQVFGTPQNLGSVVNRSGDELAVSINRASSDTMIVFGYAPPGGTGDLYQAIYAPSTDRWSAPSALPAPVNSTGYEHSASNQGSQIVFTAWRSLPATNFDLWQSLWKGKAFTSPTVLTGVSTTSNESYPFITADGSKLLFASDRPGGAGSYDLFQGAPTASGWGNVTRLGSPISSSASDISPFIAKDGSTIFFSSSRNGTFDIFYAKKKGSGWDTPIAFGAPLNTSSAEQSPALTDDGTRLYFISNRPGGYGGLDLYVSVRK